jgi:uncharacterized protein (TIGR03437 family)
MKFVSRMLCAGTLAWLMVGSPLAHAQGVCASTSLPSRVRTEGLEEVLGTVVLNCTGLSSAPTSLTVSVSGVSLAATSATPDNISTFPLPQLVSTAAFVSGPTVSTAANSATFTFTPAAGAQNLTILGLRANLAGSGIVNGTQIVAALSSSSAGSFTVTSASLVVGIAANGLGGGTGFPNFPLNIVACNPAIITPTGEPATLVSNPDPSLAGANSLRVNFVEGFPDAFRAASSEDSGLGGLQGTRLRVQLTGIPANIVPYAPRSLQATSAVNTGAVSPAGSTLLLRRVDTASANGSGGAVLPAVDNQFDKIAAAGGVATIIYEVAADNAGSLDTASLLIALSANGPLASGNIDASVSLAPLAPLTTASRPQFVRSTEISVTKPTLKFQTFVGTNPTAQVLEVTNPGAGTLNWTAAVTAVSGGNWLTLSSTSGANAGSITANIASNTLAMGVYDAELVISSANAINSPLRIPVTLLNSARPVLEATPSRLQFSTSGGTPLPQEIVINSSVLATPWSSTLQTTTGGSWLSITPTSGTTATRASVAVNPAGLAGGTYSGQITLTGPEVTNSPQIVNVTLAVGTPRLTIGPSSMVFVASAGANPPSQSLQVQNAGSGALGWSGAVATQSGGNWLVISPNTAVAPSSVDVSVNSAGMQRGAYSGSVTLNSLPGGDAQTLNVSLLIDAPSVIANGLTNGASFIASGQVSAGEIVSLFGESLASASAQATDANSLPSILGGSQVLVNGVPAPLFFVSPRQINFQMPFAISGSTVDIAVVSNGVRSLPITATLKAEAPGIFVDLNGRAAALNENMSQNSTSNPALAGSTVALFATGLGALSPAVPAGTGAGTPTLSITPALSHTVKMPSLLIGGVQAEVLYSGVAPGFAGVYQINARIPASVAAANAIPVQLLIGDASSNVATLAVR